MLLIFTGFFLLLLGVGSIAMGSANYLAARACVRFDLRDGAEIQRGAEDVATVREGECFFVEPGSRLTIGSSGRK
jgi:hypothetical protein